jgi:hypothetical protein
VNTTPSPTIRLARKIEAYELLRQICEELDITPTQYEQALSAYRGISTWLAASNSALFKNVEIYAHGSMGIRTTNKPWSGEEFDVDLISHFPMAPTRTEPAALKKALGDRLRENAHYAKIMIEKKRCWRLNYAGQFHADVAPTILNDDCKNKGELVPDKASKIWKPTHPRGYRGWFDQRAALPPRLSVTKIQSPLTYRADIAPFPEHGAGASVLRRTVQILKRHRDISFEYVEADVAPISIIITTLAAHAYQIVVGLSGLETEFDVLRETVLMMPHFIEIRVVNGRKEYIVENPTTAGENFAERWNSEPQRAIAFHQWHAKVLADIDALLNVEGLDRIQALLVRMLGARSVNPVFERRLEKISNARANSQLYVAPRTGLTTASTASAASLIRPNTFFGRR